MGLLDDLLKTLEEAQAEAEGRPKARPQARPRPAPMPAPERETDEDGAEWEEDEEARPGHAPHNPARPIIQLVSASPQHAAERTVTSTPAAVAPHLAARNAVATRIRALVADRTALRDALVAREILGPPPGLRRIRPPRRG